MENKMEFKLTQNKLSKALNIVSKITSGNKATLPVLNNVLIRAEDNKVFLSTTNLDIAIVDYLPVKPNKEGSVTVPARLLAEFVGNLPKTEEVSISAKDTKITISAGKYKSIINGTVADEFPEIPKIDEEKAVKFIMGIDEFKNGINQIIMAASNDMTRPSLTGIYFNTFEKALYVAATDGYRLAERKIIDKVESEIFAIVPASSLQEVLRSINDGIDEIEILFDDSQVIFRLGEIEITSKLIDASFPDYRQLIPNNNEVVLRLKKDEMLRVTKLASLFAREVGGSINLESKKEKGILSVASVTNEYGENDSKIETDVSENGRVTLNSRFLIDSLNALEENEIILEFSGKLTPVVVRNSKSKKYTHIIMPLKS